MPRLTTEYRDSTMITPKETIDNYKRECDVWERNFEKWYSNGKQEWMSPGPHPETNSLFNTGYELYIE